MSKSNKSTIAFCIVLVIVSCAYGFFAYRNHVYFEMYNKDLISPLIFSNILDEPSNISVEVDENNGKIDGYKDYKDITMYIEIDSDSEIEYIEPSEEVNMLYVTCNGDGEHNLENFTEYYPNVGLLTFEYCNFSDDYNLNMKNLHIIDFNYSTNFNYDMITDSDTLSTIGIDDSNMQSNEIPIFSESVTRIDIEMDEPFAYDFSSFPDGIEIINIKTSYDGDENEDTIYGLENYPNLEHFSYENAKYITQESYDYVIENEITGIPDDIEVIE